MRYLRVPERPGKLGELEDRSCRNNLRIDRINEEKGETKCVNKN